MMELETINRLFLELSQFCTATTKRESELQSRVRELDDQLRWRKWPEEKPVNSGRYLVLTDGSTDIGYHVSYYSMSAGWATKDTGISHWRPIGPLPGGE
jgi:hypothetical protein